MKKLFSDEQIISILREAEAGVYACIFRPKPIIDSDVIRPWIPICSGQIWSSVGIPRFSLLKQWTTL